jgi:DNA-3-methyladenine glycosylase II
MQTVIPRGFDLELATEHLVRRDRRFARWVRRIGALDFPSWTQPFDTADALARAILYQQLSGKAAATIVGRVERAVGSRKLTHRSLCKVDDPGLRACGVSGNKTLALRDLCRRSESGEVPSMRRLQRMPDEDIVAALTEVRGIGRWTVEMLLMFRLGRPDVLPVDDLGVRKGAQILDRLEEMPTPRELAGRGERWGPYRSLAAFYLWRIVEADAAAGKPARRSQD